jgi:hypothetical protein
MGKRSRLQGQLMVERERVIVEVEKRLCFDAGFRTWEQGKWEEVGRMCCKDVEINRGSLNAERLGEDPSRQIALLPGKDLASVVEKLILLPGL